MQGSWRTNSLGVVMILGAICSVAKAYLDNDPNTVPNIEVAIGVIMAGVGMIVARDNKVSSEEAGAKSTPSTPSTGN